MPCELLVYADVPGRCDLCGTALGPKRRRWCSRACQWRFTINHRWTQARREARRRDRNQCTTCGSTTSLEVNHIVPRVGAGYGWGCHHHQANLQTLCHSCHVKVTNAQALARKELALQGEHAST
jgi:5-methylcytosine-specific restriction endonuclease McrA